jgi:MFS family permease
MNQNQESILFTPRFITIILMALALFLSIMMLTAGLPAYITATTKNAFIGGMMTTTFMIAAILTRPAIGFVIQKVNTRTLNMVVIVVLAGLIYSLSIIHATPALLVIRALQGICFGVLSTTIATMATRSMPVKRIGEGIGFYSMATSGGTSFAPMIALAILQSVSYQALILTSAALSILTLVLTILVKNNQKKETTGQTSNQAADQVADQAADQVADQAADQATGKAVDKAAQPKISFAAYAFDRRALVPCIILLFFSTTLGGVTSFLKLLGRDAGIESHVALFFLVEAIVLLVVKMVSGIVYDRFGHKVIIYPAAICGMIGLYLLSIVNSTPMLLAAGVFYGLAYGFLTPTLQTIAVSKVEKSKQSTANAMYLSFMDLGMALGAPLLGLVAGALGYRMIYTVSIFLIVALIILYTLTLGQQKKHSQNNQPILAKETPMADQP